MEPDITEKQSHISRLSEVKPRYLEPRTQKTTNVLKTKSNLSIKNKNISSSDSSTRNSSSALNKRPTGRPKKINESTTMSRDSLASPAKQQNKPLKNKTINDFEISIDSLGDSLRSSIKTDKTLSQESLIKFNNSKQTLKPSTTTIKSTFSRSNPIINKDTSRLPTKQFGKNKSLSCQTTTENSPSSVTTAKSSRLSSITSAVSSPREAFNSRRSLSTPQQHNTTIQKKSFLSAKSREILAAKKQTLQHTESTKSVPGVIREKLQAPPSGVNKSSSTSNILARRPNTFPTTLHLRRSAKLNGPSDVAPPAPQSVKLTKINNASNKNIRSNVVAPTTTNQKKSTNVGNKIKVEIEKDEKPAMRIESKLERSSTFCKETSDIPTSELQIIE